MTTKVPITIAHGDGIGPEIIDAALSILKEAGAAIDIEPIKIGEKVYLRGNTSGIEPSAWESLRQTKVFLKAPITTPQGGGFKSLNVTARKRLGLYANVRPCVSYHPFVDTKHPNVDVVMVRENEEDLYAGIEYQISPEVIDNRGVKVWPDSMAETFCTDSFRCRFTSNNGSAVTQAQILGVLQRIVAGGLEIVQTVGLQSFDGKSGFTLAQGQ